jgi:hypothetical protein
MDTEISKLMAKHLKHIDVDIILESTTNSKRMAND